MKKIILLALVTFSLPFLAQAGRESGGGVVFRCWKGWSGAWLDHDYFLVDTYRLFRSNEDNILKRLGTTASEEQTIAVILGAIDSVDPGVSAQIKSNLKLLKYIPTKHLDLLGDDDITDIPKYCEKRQLAVQHFDIDTVMYDAYIYNSLTPAEKAFLKLHEAYIKIYHTNTASLRDKVATLAVAPDFEKNARLSFWNTEITGIPKCAESQPVQIPEELIGHFLAVDERTQTKVRAAEIGSEGFRTIPTVGYASYRRDGWGFTAKYTAEYLLQEGFCVEQSVVGNDDKQFILRVDLKRQVSDFPATDHVEFLRTDLILDKATHRVNLSNAKGTQGHELLGFNIDYETPIGDPVAVERE